MANSADAPPTCRRACHLHPVRRGRTHLRDRLVAPARPRVREHHAGRVGDPHRVLRRDGDRGHPRRADRRPGSLAAAAVRPAGDRARRRRAGHAADVRAHQRGLSRHLPGARGHAVPRHRPPHPRGPRPGAGDDHDGRHVPGPRPPLHAHRRPSARRSAACTRPTRWARSSARCSRGSSSSSCSG